MTRKVDPSESRLGRVLALLAQILLLVALFAAATTPVWDIDFWWHAATGKAIVESNQIPDSDPLGVYQVTDLRGKVLLRAYWLSQVAFFGVYEVLGATGIILLRALMLTLVLALVMLRSGILGASSLWTSLIGLLVGLTALNFTGDRPVLVSFVGISAMFLLVDFLGRQTAALILLPILMLVWANCHGAVALGAVLLALVVFVLPLEWRLTRTSSSHGSKCVIVALLAAILASLASPNGIDLYRLLWKFQGSDLQARTSEYMTPLVAWREHDISMPGYWILLLLAVPAAVGMMCRRRLAALVVTAALATLSVTAVRYVPFFVFGAAPQIALALSDMLPQVRRRWPKILANISVALIACAVLVWGASTKRIFRTGLKEGRFPVAAVELLNHSGAAGKAFNHVNWGGYLAFHSGPRIRTFIDGRNLDLEVFHKYTHILWVTPLGQQLLVTEGFDLVLAPNENPLTKEHYPLNDYLSRHPGWRRIHSDSQGQLFARVASGDPERH